MILTIKLSGATYTMRMESKSLTVDVTTMSEATDGKPSKPVTSILGHYGPAQVDKAVDRIIREQITSDEERGNLRRFLEVYKSIHEIIKPQLEQLTETLKANK